MRWPLNLQNIRGLSLQQTQAIAWAFIDWWLGELSWFIPGAIGRRLRQGKAVKLLRLAGVIRIDDMVDGKVSGTTYASRPPPAQRQQQANDDRTPVQVTLADDQILIEHFWVPDAARKRLRQLLTFEVDRRSPFPAGETVFAFVVVSRDERNKTFEVECAITRRSSIEDARNMAHALGYMPVAIGYAGEAAPLRHVFVQEQQRRSFHLDRAAAAVVLASAVFAGSLVYAGFDHSNGATRLAGDAAALKTEALKAQAVQKNAQALVDAAGLIGDRLKEPRAADILLAATNALPDDSWVSTLELRGNQLTLTGVSTSASLLIERLAAVPLFDHPHFRSAITPQGGSSEKGAERFDIVVTIPARHKTEDGSQGVHKTGGGG